MDVESTILSFSDDQGILYPGTGDWDFQTSRTMSAASTQLTDNDLTDQFDEQNRFPIEIDLEINSRQRTFAPSAIPFQETMNVGEAYSDVLLFPIHDIQLAGVDVTRTIPDRVKPLSEKRWRKLIDLAGVSSREENDAVFDDTASEDGDVVYNRNSNVAAKNDSNFEDTVPVLESNEEEKEEISEEKVADAPKTPSSKTSPGPLRLSQLTSGTPDGNDTSWIGSGVRGLRASSNKSKRTQMKEGL